MEKPESGIRNRNRNRNRNLNWDWGKLASTETSSRYPCGNKIQDGVLCYHCFEKFLAQLSWYQRYTHIRKVTSKKKKNIITKIQTISPCCSAADSSKNSRHNNFTFSNVLTFQPTRRFVAICKRKQICFCKMVTFFSNSVKRRRMKTFIFLLVPFLKRAPCFIHWLHCGERRQREEEYSCQSWSQVATLTRIWNSRRKRCCAVREKCDNKKYNNNK